MVSIVLHFAARRTILGLELLVADAEFVTAVTHEHTQFANAQVANFVHANQQRCAYRETAMANLADDRRRNLERTRQGGVILQVQLFNQRIKQIIRVIGDLISEPLAYGLFKRVVHNSCDFHRASSITGMPVCFDSASSPGNFFV